MPLTLSSIVLAMRRPRAAGRLLTLIVALASLWLSSSLTLQARPQAAAAAVLSPYDLRADEGIGGHTLARHVGKSDAELADRLRREPRISAASTYTDEDTARRVVAQALADARRRVEAWAARSGPRPNLVVNFRGGSTPIGRSLRRGARVAAVATQALIVLRWHERQGRWYVLTSYPEERR